MNITKLFWLSGIVLLIIMLYYMFNDDTTVWDVIKSPGQPTDTWDDLNSVCKAKGKKLCSRNELCTGADNKTPNSILRSFFGDSAGELLDNWFAVSDAPNEWGTYNSKGGRECKTHKEIAGRAPAWGLTRDKQNFYKAAKCC